MKAIVVKDRAAGTAGMKLVERPEPQAAINDVVVQIHASGFVPSELTWPSTWTDRSGRDRLARSWRRHRNNCGATSRRLLRVMSAASLMPKLPQLRIRERKSPLFVTSDDKSQEQTWSPWPSGINQGLSMLCHGRDRG